MILMCLENRVTSQKKTSNTYTYKIDFLIKKFFLFKTIKKNVSLRHKKAKIQ